MYVNLKLNIKYNNLFKVGDIETFYLIKIIIFIFYINN